MHPFFTSLKTEGILFGRAGLSTNEEKPQFASKIMSGHQWNGSGSYIPPARRGIMTPNPVPQPPQSFTGSNERRGPPPFGVSPYAIAQSFAPSYDSRQLQWYSSGYTAPPQSLGTQQHGYHNPSQTINFSNLNLRPNQSQAPPIGQGPSYADIVMRARMQQEQQMLNNHIDSQGNSSVSKSQQTIFSDTSSQSKRKRESSNSAHGREWPTMNEEYSDSFKNWGLRVLNSSSSDKKKSVFKEFVLWEANRAIHFNYMQTKNWDETEIPKLKQMKALLNFEPTRYPPPNMKNIQSSESPRIHKSSMRSPVKSPVIAKKSSSEVVENAEKISQRMRRFQRSEVLAPSVFSNEIENDIFRFDSLGIQGTCQSLEKKYLRLTSAPDPTSVRPERVLRKAIEMIRKKWTDKKDYAYVCEQLKSVRQDLGVQHIRNSLTLDTYELHARIALEAGDLSEYNQCQTQLFNLFGEDPSHKERIYFEFVSYRILYCIITEDTASMYSFLASLKPKDFENSLIQNALRIQTAFASLDYHQFFVRYRSSSFLAKCLIKDVLHIVRYRALCIICKAYLQVPVSFVQEELGFEDLTECLEFLLAAGIQLDQANDKILCKSSSVVAVPKVRSKAPVDSAVTHGSFH